MGRGPELQEGRASRCKPGVCCTPWDWSPSVVSVSVICHLMKGMSSPVLVGHLSGSQTHRQYPGIKAALLERHSSLLNL